jgi:hypothetical protein
MSIHEVLVGIRNLHSESPRKDILHLHGRLLYYLGVQEISASDLVMCYSYATFSKEKAHLKELARDVCVSLRCQEGIGDAVRAYAAAFVQLD